MQVKTRPKLLSCGLYCAAIWGLGHATSGALFISSGTQKIPSHGERGVIRILSAIQISLLASVNASKRQPCRWRLSISVPRDHYANTKVCSFQLKSCVYRSVTIHLQNVCWVIGSCSSHRHERSEPVERILLMTGFYKCERVLPSSAHLLCKIYSLRCRIKATHPQ